MAIYVTGDTHGPERAGANDGFIPRFNTENFPEQKGMTKDDFVIVCGDFGGIWAANNKLFAEEPREKHALDWLENKPFTTLFVPGNHENYDRLTGCKDETLLNSWLYARMPEPEKEKLRAGYPQEDRYGGTVRVLRPSVLMLEHGVFDLNGVTIFAYGGAPSHDISGGILNPTDFETEKAFLAVYQKWWNSGRLFRVRGISWWEQEMPDLQTEQRASDMLDTIGRKVDFIITHDCTMSDREVLGYTDERFRLHTFLESVKKTTEYKHWFFGHLHDNKNMPDGKGHLLYKQIVRIA